MLGSPAVRLGLREMLAYSAGSIGTGAFYSFNNFILPLLLSAMRAPDLMIGLLSSTRSIEGVVVQPVVGAVSDRLATPLGRRRPFLLVAIPLSALFFFLAPLATDLVQVAAAIFLFSIFFNVAIDPYAALLPDIAPPEQRGVLSGLSNAVGFAGQVAFLAVVSIASLGGNVPAWTYSLCGAVVLASFAVTFGFISEPRQLVERAAQLPLRSYFEALVRNTGALRYLGTIFVYQFGLSAVIPFLPLFITKDLGFATEIAIALSALTLLVTGVSAFACGLLADRSGHGPVLAVGWAILAVAAIGGTIIRSLPETVAIVVLAGIGNGAATVVKWPLLTLLIPREETGIYAGLSAAADSIAIPLSVFVASELFLPNFGYRGIFAMLAVNIVIALALFLAFVRVPRLTAATSATAQ